ncbi:hypothetical protein B0H19DRAFT_1366731 [Mycena capillaripes]|nr:hypothetical protein B0H19DRAFT_1366731 [Mycena capillaripes]
MPPITDVGQFGRAALASNLDVSSHSAARHLPHLSTRPVDDDASPSFNSLVSLASYAFCLAILNDFCASTSRASSSQFPATDASRFNAVLLLALSYSNHAHNIPMACVLSANSVHGIQAYVHKKFDLVRNNDPSPLLFSRSHCVGSTHSHHPMTIPCISTRPHVRRPFNDSSAPTSSSTVLLHCALHFRYDCAQSENLSPPTSWVLIHVHDKSGYIMGNRLPFSRGTIWNTLGF